MIKGLFFSKKEKISSSYGLDIGSFSIKLTELRKSQNNLELNNFAIGHIKGDKQKQKVIEAIREAINQVSTSIKRVNLSISGQAVVVRYIQMPKMNEAELKSAIKFEAEKYIPFKVNEVNLDAQILGEGADKSNMRVLLVAAKKEVVDKYISLLEELGLDINLIDIDALSLTNIFLLQPASEASDKICALLNIGARSTTVNIYQQGQSCFTREINIAGDELTRAIADKMNVALEAAEELKCTMPSNKVELLSKAMQPVLDNLISEVRASFDYFESQFAGGVSKIYICGGSAVLNGLDKLITQSLGIPTSLWNPLSGLKVRNELTNTNLSLIAPSLGVSLGLALRE